jgi:hypothetical protein
MTGGIMDLTSLLLESLDWLMTVLKWWTLSSLVVLVLMVLSSPREEERSLRYGASTGRQHLVHGDD